MRSVAFSPDGRLLASASSDQIIKLWDPHTGEHLMTLECYSPLMTSVPFSPGGLLALSLQGHGLIHDMYSYPHTGEYLRTLQVVDHMAFSLDGRFLASASSDNCRPTPFSLQGHGQIHDTCTGQLVQTQGTFSFPVAGGDQSDLTLENYWVCHGVAHIFHLPSSFSISTWKQRGSLVCFGSQAGQVLILDIHI